MPKQGPGFPMPKQGPGFPMPYVMVFFMVSCLGSEVIVCFGDIGRIVDHHCLNFLFIMYNQYF